MVKDHPNDMIEIKGVTKSFGGINALNGVDATIREGEFFSLLGPSGCGKTTLLRLIAGFEQATAGTIAISGKLMKDTPANQRPTNMVFQNYAIFPHLNVAENVGYGLTRKKMSKAERAEAVEKALEMVDLAGYGRRKAHELSGGQRQRVALARALVMRPKVILLDEPLSALDKKLRDQMQHELRQLQKSLGITFVLVTHDQEEALIMSDRIAVIFDGKIAQLATPEELYRRPLTHKVASFIGVMNFLDATATGGGDSDFHVSIAGLGDVDVPRAHAPDGLLADQIKFIGVRPEMFTIVDEGTGAFERNVKGTVTGADYYGDMTYYTVALEGVSDPVMVSMRNTAGRTVAHEGDNVTVGWGAESIVLLE